MHNFRACRIKVRHGHVLHREFFMRFRSALMLFGLLGFCIISCGCRSSSGKTRVAFVSNNADGFWTFAQRGAEKAASEFDVDLDFRKPPDGSAKEQREIIENLINRGFKGVAVSPNDPQNNLKFYKDTVASKMFLVMVDNDLPDATARRCYIGTHNYRAGRAAGELVKKALPKGGKIAFFVGRMDATNAIERRQGVIDVLAGLELKEMGKVTPPDAANLDLGNDYTLVTTKTDDNDEGKCQAHAEDLLNKQPSMNCLIGLWAWNPPALLARSATRKTTTSRASWLSMKMPRL